MFGQNLQGKLQGGAPAAGGGGQFEPAPFPTGPNQDPSQGQGGGDMQPVTKGELMQVLMQVVPAIVKKMMEGGAQTPQAPGPQMPPAGGPPMPGQG